MCVYVYLCDDDIPFMNQPSQTDEKLRKLSLSLVRVCLYLYIYDDGHWSTRVCMYVCVYRRVDSWVLATMDTYFSPLLLHT